jgi:hypothetical protein
MSRKFREDDFANLVKRLNELSNFSPEQERQELLEAAKKELISQIHTSTLSNTHNSKIIIDLLSKDPSEIDRKNLEYFVKEFCKRRNIKPNFMPASLKKWLNLL